MSADADSYDLQNVECQWLLLGLSYPQRKIPDSLNGYCSQHQTTAIRHFSVCFYNYKSAKQHHYQSRKILQNCNTI